MEVIQEVLNGALLIKPKVFSDSRGYFSETFNEQSLNKIIGEVNFVQDNQSLSQKGVLNRALAYYRSVFQGSLDGPVLNKEQYPFVF